MSRLRKSTALVLLSVGTGACYATVPVQSERPIVGSDLVLRLNDLGTAQLASLLGPRVVQVTGRLVSLPADTLVVSVSSTTQNDGEETFWKGERIAAPANFIAVIQQKKLSTFRSAAVGVAVAAAAFAIRSVAKGGSSGPPSNKPPNGQ